MTTTATPTATLAQIAAVLDLTADELDGYGERHESVEVGEDWIPGTRFEQGYYRSEVEFELPYWVFADGSVMNDTSDTFRTLDDYIAYAQESHDESREPYMD